MTATLRRNGLRTIRAAWYAWHVANPVLGRPLMPKHASLIAAAIVAALAAPAVAQQPSPPAFEKKEFTHSAWTKGIFSEAVTVKGAGRMIFLAGVGSEDENGPRGN